jgi:hypothetical protein
MNHTYDIVVNLAVRLLRLNRDTRHLDIRRINGFLLKLSCQLC